MDVNSIVQQLRSRDMSDRELAIMAMKAMDVYRDFNLEQLNRILPELFKFCNDYMQVIEEEKPHPFTGVIMKLISHKWPLMEIQPNVPRVKQHNKQTRYVNHWTKDPRYKKMKIHKVVQEVLRKISHQLYQDIN